MHGIDPSEQVCLLFREKSSALLLVEEDDGNFGKALAPHGGYSDLRIGLAESCSPRDGFQLCIEATVKQDQKTESSVFDPGAFSDPRICLRTRGIVQPVSRVGEGLSEFL